MTRNCVQVSGSRPPDLYRKKAQEILLCLKIMNIPGLYPCFYTLISAFIPSTSRLASRMGFTTSARNSSTCLGARPT